MCRSNGLWSSSMHSYRRSQWRMGSELMRTCSRLLVVPFRTLTGHTKLVQVQPNILSLQCVAANPNPTRAHTIVSDYIATHRISPRRFANAGMQWLTCPLNPRPYRRPSMELSE